MATHTHANASGGAHVRRFELGSEDFTKEGKPAFREWLRNGIPANYDPAKRRFAKSTKGEPNEVFAAISGRLVGIETESRTIENEERIFLMLQMEDDAEAFLVKVGDVDGRYALNLLQRFCSEEFNPSKEFTMTPYRWRPEGENSKEVFGINVVQDGVKISPRKETDESGYKPPQADRYPQPRGKDKLDFMPVARYCYGWVTKYVMPKTKALLTEPQPPANSYQHEPVNTNVTASPAASEWNDPVPSSRTGFADDDGTPVNTDDLPF
jgi:hypothetical protein